jgi:hypothetical protein
VSNDNVLDATDRSAEDPLNGSRIVDLVTSLSEVAVALQEQPAIDYPALFPGLPYTRSGLTRNSQKHYLHRARGVRSEPREPLSRFVACGGNLSRQIDDEIS